MRALLRLVSLRHLRRHTARTLLTTLGVTLGVGAGVAISLVNASVEIGLRRVAEEMAGKAGLVVSGDRTGLPESLLGKVKKVRGIRLATPVIKQAAAIHAVDGRATGGMLQIYALDTLDDRSVPDTHFRKEDLYLPDPLLFISQPRSLIVTRSFARKHGLGKRINRAKVRLTTPGGVVDFTVRGILRSEGPEKTFGGNIALMDVYAAQKVFGRNGKFDEIDLHLAGAGKAVDLERVRRRVRDAVGTGFTVERPATRGRQAQRIISAWQSGMSLLALVALSVVMFLVYNTVAVAVAERRREIGILRALGVRRREVLALFALEAMVIGGVGSLIGLGVGLVGARQLVLLTSRMLTNLVIYTDVQQLQLSGATLAGWVLMGVVVTFLAAFVPALSASRVSPLEATRTAPPESRRKRARRWAVIAGLIALVVAGVAIHQAMVKSKLSFAAVGIMSLVLGFVLCCAVLAPALTRAMAPLARIAFGIVGRLAADNIRRSPGRTTVTIGAIVVGVALVVSSTTVANSFRVSVGRYVDRNTVADVMVTCTTEIFGPSAMPMTKAVEKEIRTVRGLEEILRVRVVDLNLGGRRADLYTVKVEAWQRRVGFSMLGGDSGAIAERVARGEGIAVSENFSKTFGYRVGDRVPIPTPRGTIRLPVLGVFRDYASPFGVVVLDRSMYERHWNDDLTDIYHLYLAEGVDPISTRAALERHLTKRFNVFVLTTAQVKRKVRGLIDDAFAIIRLQDIIAILVALLGLLNTLIISVLERTREIGVLRALGALRRQVAASIIIESLLMGLAGAILGFVLGLGLSWINVDVVTTIHTGWRFGYHVNVGAALELLGLLLCTAAVAAFLPSRRASRKPITEALEYE